MINFHCVKCDKRLPHCKCPDLHERLLRKYWDSSLFDYAMDKLREWGYKHENRSG
jgi:hypothetical protein